MTIPDFVRKVKKQREDRACSLGEAVRIVKKQHIRELAAQGKWEEAINLLLELV